MVVMVTLITIPWNYPPRRIPVTTKIISIFFLGIRVDSGKKHLTKPLMFFECLLILLEWAQKRDATKSVNTPGISALFFVCWGVYKDHQKRWFQLYVWGNLYSKRMECDLTKIVLQIAGKKKHPGIFENHSMDFSNVTRDVFVGILFC